LSYDNQTVLITGGTGSFGNAMVNHLRSKGCREIRIFSRDESKQDAMRRRLTSDGNVRFFIGDVRDRDSVDRVMHGVDLVFHAAALKQVPSCEFFPLEAVATNIMGSANVVQSAIAQGAGSVVLLGTDKAVLPINAMGMTKALMEKVGQAAARELALNSSDTTVSVVRYGNVMYSRGSVIPMFVEQIRAGEPLTITEPTMTRFLLPLAQAVDLVEFAFNHARNGDVFVRKAPASTISDLAQAIQNLFRRPVGIRRLGIRHGEKLYETLASSQELRHSEDCGDYFRLRMDNRDLNYAAYFEEGDREEVLIEDYNSHNTQRLTVPEIEELLLTLPEIRAELRIMKA
jgi:UDP-N-acetylglucosamine 4,6-dehydratase/5-epimerase